MVRDPSTGKYLRVRLFVLPILRRWNWDWCDQRELARPVTFFDLCSPSIFFGSMTGEFFRKKSAIRDEFRNWLLRAA
jgi:hypothetical protein